jgi:hypothetical protein
LLANRLAHRVLGRSLDELPPGTRRLLDLLEQIVAAAAAEQGVSRERASFTRRELREQLGWGDTQLKVHLARLVSLELVYAHRGAHGVFVYELAWDRDQVVDGALLPGLIDPDQLDGEHGYDPDRSGSGEDRSGDGRPLVARGSVPGHPAENGQDSSNDGRSDHRASEHAADSGSGEVSFLAAEPVAVEAVVVEAMRVAG